IIVGFWRTGFYGLMTGKSSTDALQERNPEELTTQPWSSVPLILILSHSLSALRPTGSIVSPFDRKAKEENALLGPLRTFNAWASTLQAIETWKSRIVSLSKWIWTLAISNDSTKKPTSPVA